VIARPLAALLCGTLFGLGLAVAQMTSPLKVLAFLDIFGNWDPSLALVMAGAVGVTLIGFRFVLRRPAPAFDVRFYLPTRQDLDRPLLIGSALFGIGWGIAGYCPGPVVAALAFGSLEAVIFVAAMLVGAQLHRVVPARSR